MSDNASAPSVPAELGFWMHFEFRVSPADLQNSLRPIPSLPAGLCIADAWSGGGTRVVRREAPNERQTKRCVTGAKCPNGLHGCFAFLFLRGIGHE